MYPTYFQIVTPPGSNRIKPPPGIRTQPLPPDQRHFPPGPQKAIRVPTRILRRKESEYERGSLRLQPVRQTQTPTSLMREVGEVQQIQQMISVEEMARAKRDQEMSTPIPQDPHISNQQQVEQDGQDQNRVTEEKPSSTTSLESPSSSSLDLEELMEQTEVKTVHTASPVKES